MCRPWLCSNVDQAILASRLKAFLLVVKCAVMPPKLMWFSLLLAGARPHSGLSTAAAGGAGSLSSERVMVCLSALERFYGVKQLADNKQSMHPLEFRYIYLFIYIDRGSIVHMRIQHMGGIMQTTAAH